MLAAEGLSGPIKEFLYACPVTHIEVTVSGLGATGREERLLACETDSILRSGPVRPVNMECNRFGEG
jgi:hypothetical protein